MGSDASLDESFRRLFETVSERFAWCGQSSLDERVTALRHEDSDQDLAQLLPSVRGARHRGRLEINFSGSTTPRFIAIPIPTWEA
jgi:hypothetical protein